MSTDAEESYIEASFDALRAAVRHAHGDQAAPTDIEDALARLSGTTNILAHMGGWAAAVAYVIPAFAARAATLASVSSRTGRHVNPDGKVPTDLLLGSRLAVALLNDDTDTAVALWHTTVDHGAQDTAVRTVLRHMATLLAPHMPSEENPTDA